MTIVAIILLILFGAPILTYLTVRLGSAGYFRSKFEHVKEHLKKE